METTFGLQNHHDSRREVNVNPTSHHNRSSLFSKRGLDGICDWWLHEGRDPAANDELGYRYFTR